MKNLEELNLSKLIELAEKHGELTIHPAYDSKPHAPLYRVLIERNDHKGTIIRVTNTRSLPLKDALRDALYQLGEVPPLSIPLGKRIDWMYVWIVTLFVFCVTLALLLS